VLDGLVPSPSSPEERPLVAAQNGTLCKKRWQIIYDSERLLEFTNFSSGFPKSPRLDHRPNSHNPEPKPFAMA
jgi:hypothetical protein